MPACVRHCGHSPPPCPEAWPRRLAESRGCGTRAGSPGWAHFTENPCIVILFPMRLCFLSCSILLVGRDTANYFLIENGDQAIIFFKISWPVTDRTHLPQ